MNDVLREELTGRPPVMVVLGGAEYPLAFPMRSIILYKQETAKLNRARGLASPKLSPSEVREVRERHSALLVEASKLKGAEFQRAIQEATLVKLPLDEAAGTGDSLLLMHNWWRISLDDPERIVLALWAGLHQEQPDKSWKAPFTLAELESEKLINMGNVGDFLPQITEALISYIKRETDDSEGEPAPNAPAPEAAAPAETNPEIKTSPSSSSGPSLVATSA